MARASDSANVGASAEAESKADDLLTVLLENTPDYVYFKDRERRFVRASRSFVELLGVGLDEIIGKRDEDLFPPHISEHTIADDRRVIEEGVPLVNRIEGGRLSEGVERWVSTTKLPWRGRGGEICGLYGISKDITELQRAKQALEASEERRRLALEASGQGTWELDVDAWIATYDEQHAMMLGYRPDELTGQDGDQFMQSLHPDDRQQCVAAFERYLRGEVSKYEARFRLRTKAGDWKWIHTSGKTIERHADGRPRRMIGTHTDITTQVEAELRRVAFEQRLRHTQRLEALGTLAGGIAHDFNNLLMIISTNVELIRSGPGSHAPVLAPYLEDVATASSRASELVRQILAFSRQQSTRRTVVALDELVENTAKMLRAMLPAGVALRVDTGATRARVFADPTLLHQLVMNLGTNAWHAFEGDRGEIALLLDCVSVPASGAAPPAPDLAPGDYARITVTDDGRGMDDSTLERIFDPFFTTKGPGEGTGLGMAIVHGIVHDHDGVLTVETAPNQGTRVQVYLPTTEELNVEDGDDIAPGGRSKARVLLIDDEELVVTSTTKLLNQLGYDTVGMRDAFEALASIRDDPMRFDVVVTDHRMPTASGLDVARAIKEMRADLPVLLISGFLDRISHEAIADSGIREIIQKPCSPRDFDTVLQRVIRAPSR